MSLVIYLTTSDENGRAARVWSGTVRDVVSFRSIVFYSTLLYSYQIRARSVARACVSCAAPRRSVAASASRVHRAASSRSERTTHQPVTSIGLRVKSSIRTNSISSWSVIRLSNTSIRAFDSSEQIPSR